MRSKSAITYEIDDMKTAANELLDGLNGFTLGKNSIGILYCATEANIYELLKELKPKLPFDIVGNTTHAVLDNKNGMNEFATNLVVMTSDDCNFNVFVSEPFDAATLRDRIENLCKIPDITTLKDVKLILCYTPFVPGIILDDYADYFHEFTGGKPVFGGVSGLDIDRNFSAVLHNLDVYTDRIVAVFIGGNIRPVFSIGSNISSSVNKKQTVTSSKDNIIYTVDDTNFIEYLRSVGISTDMPRKYALDILLASVTLNVEIDDGHGNDGIGVHRSIYSLNFEDGSGTALGRVPQGSKVCAATYKIGDISLSTYDCLIALIDRMNKAKTPDYTYSTILCGSCHGRYMFMMPSKNIEGEVIMEYAPKDLTFAGYYTYGEICPTSVNGDVAVNRSHNATLTMCAF